MNESPECAVCGAVEWTILDRASVRRDAPISNEPAVALRRRVLFEVWLPGQEEITLTTVCCGQCGFVSYTPRPTEADVAAKYRFLQATEIDIGGQKGTPREQTMDRGRAERIFGVITRHVQKPRLRVLDFGGGNGKLLAPFLEQGHDCDLIDYSLKPLPGVRKIADTLEEDTSGRCYDAIICSHVLEHVGNPGNVVSRLGARLAEKGVLYGEVPCDLWEDLNISTDPVTHINFFSLESFRSLFIHRGLHVLESASRLGTYSDAELDVIIVIAGWHGPPSEAAGAKRAVALTRSWLHPSLLAKVKRRWRFGQMPTVAGVIRRLKRLAGALPD